MLTPLPAILLGIPLIAVAPIVMVLYSFKKGYVDLHVSEGERRPVFFLPAIVAYLSAATVFLFLNCEILYNLSMAYLSMSFTVLLVTLFWKISIHMAALTGPITALILVFGATYAPLYLLALPLGWARTELEAHTVSQVVLGAAVGIAVTALVYVNLI